ncbi:CaiB/BaiF CoA-transferase family protein [Azoarcus sp. DN11]|uniref:CaiB/BaiF CoA transferase family protein n=1 Tax=Azoarcus sp. DN11 TaxID=356837 RepID=UPI000EB4B483|nr:CaiB/BaiF CoA-transferase family protein [Azoarcus sp. DN11]AYH43551.1 carnitine dehydratase [Azoarcus sp. DN11]
MKNERRGPLTGLKIVEFAGIGPAPFCASLLADMGADVIRIDRADQAGNPPDLLTRGRRSVALNLKDPASIEVCLALLERADALIEGFRPGVMERLGLGPDVVLARNPKLAYGRMTGWGQTGPLAQTAGHDINYIALSGALAAIGTQEQPVPPLNLAGDFGGGSLYLGLGLLAAVLHARQTGCGQVIDCSMVEGAASLMGLYYEFHAAGQWGERATNLLDGGAHFYVPYRCADGKWICIGAIEPQFYALLIEKLGLASSVDLAKQNDPAEWPAMKAKLAELIATRTRDEWCRLLEGTDACVAPILDLAEAPLHPHNLARGTFVEIDGQLQPGVAPRFSATPGQAGRKPACVGADSEAVLAEWGIPERAIAQVKVSPRPQR